MSSSEHLSIFNNDDFEGSTDEISIAQQVFYGADCTAGDERCNLSGFIGFGCHQQKVVESSPSMNTGADTSQSSTKLPCHKDGYNVHRGFPRKCPSFAEGFVLAERNDDYAVPAKCMKLSVDELSSFKPLQKMALASDAPLNAIVSGFDHPKGRLGSISVMCRVVESSGEGVSSSGYLLEQGVETEKKGCLLANVLLQDNLVASEGSEGKEIVVSNNMASPVSQESCGTKAAVTSPAVTNADKTGLCQRAVRKRKIGTPFELEDGDIPWTSECKKELRPFLRNRIFRLLAAAGWSIEKRKRQCRNYEEFVFVSPLQRPVRELAKAWIICGQILHAHRDMQMVAVNGRQWANIDHLCSDLYNTITNMDSELKNLELKDAIVRQWILLNPFVTVVFVDRKLRELRAGNVVEVNLNAGESGEKSLIVGKGRRSGGGCTTRKPCDSSLASGSTLIDFSVQCQEGKVEASTSSRSIYVSEGSFMRLLETDDKTGIHSGYVCTNDSRHQYSSSLPARGSDVTSLQPTNELYDVPIDSGNSHLVHGASLEFAAQQYIASDAVVDKPAKYRKLFDSTSLRNIKTEGHLVSKSKGKQKKSKKVHEIELSLLSEEEISNLLTPSRAEVPPQKMSDHTKKENRSRKGMSSSSKISKKRIPRKKSVPFKLKDDDLPISAIVQQEKFKSNWKKCNVKAGSKGRRLKKRKNRKGSCRLLPRNLGKVGSHIPDERWTLIAERMILSWSLHTSAVYLNEIIQYRDLKDGTVVKDGMITWDGILCRCCNKVFSISGFNIHAGLEMNLLCLNLFMDSGQPFTLRLLEAWSAEYNARQAGLHAAQSDEFDQNDDSCGLCGDGGELLCCDRCPSTFHQSCLSAEELPEGSWYCTSCTCWICGDLVDNECSSAHSGFKCYQCEHKYHLICLQELDVDRIVSNTSFCSASCEEVHAGLQSRVALYNTLADGFSWSVLKCIQDDHNVHSAQQLALKAECNSKLAVALTIMEECFVSMVDSRTGIDMIPQVIYNCGSEFPRLDYHGFYTVVLEKDDVLISVASIRVHGVEVAEMPLVATCSKYRRKGMCRRLLRAVEHMLVSFKVEKLVVAAIPDLVETWTAGFGFALVDEEEKKSLNKMSLMVFPGTVVLKKTLYREQTAGCLQGPGPAEGELSLGMDKSVQEGVILEEQFENKHVHFSSEDAGFMNVRLISPHGTEVADAQQRTSLVCLDTQKSESIDSVRAVSGTHVSMEVCGRTKMNAIHDVSPQRETSKTVEDMQMQVNYIDMLMTGGSVDSTIDDCSCPENGKSQECSFSHAVACHEKSQHEASFHVSSEVQKQPTPLAVVRDDADKCKEQSEVGVVPQEATSPKNPSHPCSSVVLEARKSDSASKPNAKLQPV